MGEEADSGDGEKSSEISVATLGDHSKPCGNNEFYEADRKVELKPR